MKAFIAMLSLMTLLSAYPARAEWSHGRPPEGRLLERLAEPCRASCFDKVRTCRDGAEASTLQAIPTHCSSQITAAQTACATDHTSQTCQDAKRTLRSCAQTDLMNLRMALYQCHNPGDIEQCVEACNSPQ